MSDTSWKDLLAQSAEITAAQEREIAEALSTEAEHVQETQQLSFDEAMEVVYQRHREDLDGLRSGVREKLHRRVDEVHVDRVAKQIVTEAEAAMLGLPEQIQNGAAIFDESTAGVPLWGAGSQILWQHCEATMISASTGVGKTTLAVQLVEALLGLRHQVLDLPVNALRDDEKILYMAMDRPEQIKRAMRRVFHRDHAPLLADRVRLWAGPPPADLALAPDTLFEMAFKYDVKVIIIDSLKDAFIGLQDDVAASSFNRGLQKVLTAGIDVLILHHNIKKTDGTINSIFGSAMITAGIGSVIALEGKAGDGVATFAHRKPVAELLDEFEVTIDYSAGRMYAQDTGPRITKPQDPPEITAILTWLKDHPESTTSEITDGLRGIVGVNRARDLLKELVDTGRVLREGNGGGYRHRLPDER